MSRSSKKSSQPEVDKKQPNEIIQPSSSTGKTTKQLMSRHMKDKNDIITDEEFRNLNINPGASDDAAQQQLRMANE